MDFKLNHDDNNYLLIADNETIMKINKNALTAEEMDSLFDRFAQVFEAGALLGFHLTKMANSDIALDMLRAGKAIHVDATSRGIDASNQPTS
ncbi:hypothetical protein [Vibrio mexicanus]|uniref:hypothetical protein n=1 Tax=Vibrio mexicanus TaxID=1004326 RepID=UPI00063C9A09|nr:hypothetical protein [Vibrio mexicanus]